jgi:hypothetical protein
VRDGDPLVFFRGTYRAIGAVSDGAEPVAERYAKGEGTKLGSRKI